jgi:hypothetical protein
MSNMADWHANQAIRHYNNGDYRSYKRHIGIADGLRLSSGEAMADKMTRFKSVFKQQRRDKCSTTVSMKPSSR